MSGTLLVHVQSKTVDMTEDSTVSNETVKLNISGTIFQVKVSTLHRFPNSRLSKLMNQLSDKEQIFYFDQDPWMFGHVLRCYRSGEIHVPKQICGHEFLKELEFWEIPVSMVSPCCWPTLYQADVNVEILNKLAEVTSESESAKLNKMALSVRDKLWNFLDNPDSSLAAKVWFYSYLAVVMLSIIVYFLWMIPSLRVPRYLQGQTFDHNHTNNKIAAMVESDPHALLFLLDSFCSLFFTLEIIARFVACPIKSRFFKTWYNAMNALLVITTMMVFILELRKDLIRGHAVGLFYYVLKNLYLFRLLLLLRLEKQFIALRILILSVKNSASELLLLLFSLLMATCIFGGLMFCAEIHTTVYPDISIALWWAIVTITTVGYGDHVPDDLPGRVIGSLCAACGIALLALPIAVIVSNFAQFYGYANFQSRHRDTCKGQRKDKGP